VLAGAAALALLVPNSSVLEHRAIIAVFLAALATGRGRQFVRDWVPLVAAASLFVLLRQFAAASPFPRQGAAVAWAEGALFGGPTPTTWLQQRLYTPGHAGPMEFAATAVHASYFFGFVLVGLAVWLFARQRFAVYTRLLALTFAAGLVGYVLAPTEPPWLAARQGIGPPAARIIVETSGRAPLATGVVELGRTWQADPDALGDPNPAAAMPSVHLAVTAALALFLWTLHPALGALGALYALAMAAALVYLGEHYVLDLVAGAICATAAAHVTVWRTAPLLPRPLLPRPAEGSRVARATHGGTTRWPPRTALMRKRQWRC
jgi:membrane-associated phospholipid phosphatase